MRYLLGWSLQVWLGSSASARSAGQLLLGGLPAGLEEQVGEVEVAPARRAEAWGDRDVGTGGVPFARVELGDVHDLEQGVEHTRARAARRLRRAEPRRATRERLRLMMLTETVMSAPASTTASVGTGTRARPSTSRLPSRSCGGNMPASAVAASSASQSGPSVTGAGACAFRSTVIATNGMTRSSKVLSPVVSRSRRGHRVEPGRPPASESLKTSSIVSPERVAHRRLDLVRRVRARARRRPSRRCSSRRRSRPCSPRLRAQQSAPTCA